APSPGRLVSMALLQLIPTAWAGFASVGLRRPALRQAPTFCRTQPAAESGLSSSGPTAAGGHPSHLTRPARADPKVRRHNNYTTAGGVSQPAPSGTMDPDMSREAGRR